MEEGGAVLKSTQSPDKLDTILFKVGTNKIANIWIRKNERVVQLEDSQCYEYDEVYFTMNSKLISISQISNDIDFYFNIMSNEPDGANADRYSISNLKQSKREEMSQACQDAIINGFDIWINGVKQHFSLTEHDQINLMSLQSLIMSGSEWIPYHGDGQPCIYYSSNNASAIINEALDHKIFHTTYCNSMFNWIDHLNKASEIYALSYGDKIPFQYQSDVLKDLLQ